MDQVGIMKEAIKESRESEVLNKELLMLSKDKTDKIASLKINEKMLQDQLKSKDNYI